MKNYLVMAGIAVGVVVIWGSLFAPVQKVINQTTQLGSGGNDIAYSDHLCFGGVCRYAFSQTMTQGASTTCQWQTPAATSTVSIHARFALASTSASLVEFGKSTGPYATTTNITRITLGAGAQGTIYATTTSSSGSDDVLVAAPSTWLAVKIGGGATGSVPSGTCNFGATTLP